MQSVCEQVIRCLCSCLIKKAQVPYNDVNEQHNEFIKLGDQVDEDHRLNRQQKQYIGSPTTLTVANKLSNYLEEDNKISTNSLQSKQIANTSTISTISKKQPLLELQNKSSKTYMNVIPQDHPYYHLFKQKLVDLEHIFQVPPQACVAEPEAAYPLKMHCFQDGKLNCFKYFYRFPTDYHTYEAISNDFQLQKQFDPNIDEFRKVLQTPGGDAKLIYLSYKKVLIMSSRDFQYVRYTFKKDNEYWNICISDTSREQVKGKVRGQMLLTATRIIEHSGEIEVSVSSTTDMKIPIKLQIAKNRGFAEIRKYLDRVYQHIKEDQGKSII